MNSCVDRRVVDSLGPIETPQANGVCQNESTSVYGNVYDSELHNMVTAVHMRGHKQGDVSGNVLHSNIMNGKAVLFVIFSLSPEFFC